MKVFGYETKTTFWDDFTIAEVFGESAIKATYKRAFKQWRKNYEYLTELVMVLNWKMWAHEEDAHLCRLYHDLWANADEYACLNLKDGELEYFYQTTD